MSQHDFDILNQLFPATRTDLNAAFVALASNSSGDAEPAIKYANQWWYETDTHTLKIRNEANSNWISICTLDQSNNNVLSITTQGLTLGATALTSTGADLNQLTDLTRGSLIYGNASGATARLAKGGAGTVLSSDGTDIAWAASAGGVAIGTVVSLATSTEPTGYLECDGAAVSRSTYSGLFSTIASTYGAGDGSSTFNLPDLRGEFIRGFDNSRGIDASRVLGSAQGQRANNFATARFFTGGNGSDTTVAVPENGTTSGSIYSGANLSTLNRMSFNNRGGETRPRNIALMYCIKT